jgi:uncharacterized membrane protein YcaP (DUF421 family)
MFFSSWQAVSHILIIGVLGYIALVLLLRISGNRTLSKMNSFDFIITIALGSTFATAILDKKTTLLDAILTFSLLVLLQHIVTYLSVRYRSFEKLVKSDPVLLFHRGKFLRDNMKNSQVSEAEIQSGIRQEGLATVDEVEFVVLEENGKISVTRKTS